MRRAKIPHRRSGWLLLTAFVFLIAIVFGAGTYLIETRAVAFTDNVDFEVVTYGSGGEPSFPQTPDFSKFSHNREAHSRLPCLLCHRRDSDAPTQKFPGHTPCAGCHAHELANAGSPICTICHTNVQSGAMKPFPPLKSFNVKFDHARHVGSGRSSSQCATCHRPTRRGVALSIPAGSGGHSTCFQCHTSRALGREGQDIASCSTCHNMAGYSRTPQTSRAYRINFSHAVHGRRKNLNCSSCHFIQAGMPQRRQVRSPLPVMHAASPRVESCLSCHNDKRAFGIAVSTNCKRCHQGQTFKM